MSRLKAEENNGGVDRVRLRVVSCIEGEKTEQQAQRKGIEARLNV